ncbi:MAG: High-affinity branched-chain amino acid transport ATP-binding protein LivG [Thermacetogenium phaeum]|uniref:High-affinity branched-chain amino acid transport ATP-binding protein LivG n=1 Tax=Thermacetogenium phaeum TaxID=85874 RepID=A0A101FHC8_9THEO|nr:MAG: High-affinity branched-chain amino acid transport ATP-binding protein LivG [Thermacetogenium phaeum]
MPLLEVSKLSKSFGGLVALYNFNLVVEQGELVGLIGPNGAGKTTVFNLLTGLYPPSSGKMCFAGKDLRGKKPHQITRMGIARTFQNIRLFGNLTVLDNVKIAYQSAYYYGLIPALFRLPPFQKREKEIEEASLELLEIFNLRERADERAANLPYGEQRRLEIARALATKPRLLLLDEPAAGMNPQETKELQSLIRWVKDQFQLTVILIEHDMSLVMGVCERVVVLDYGSIIAEGTPEEIRKNPRVIEAYLGDEEVAS